MIIDDAGRAEERPPAQAGPAPAGPGELLFPLAANEDQYSVARELAARQGVLVQGPPGTGKSQTIANLICQLLAEGKRVLVTSHAARALRVLHRMIPAEVSALCVSLVGNDREAMQSLEDSVGGITNKHHLSQPEASAEEIKELEEELDKAKRRQARVPAELRAIVEKETYQHPPMCGGYEGTAAAIAERLRREEERFSWLTDRPQEGHHAPVSNNEARELLQLLREFGQEALLGADGLGSIPTEFPTPTDFESLLQREAEASARYKDSMANAREAHCAMLQRLSRQDKVFLRSLLRDFLGDYDELLSYGEGWVCTAVAEVIADEDQPWRRLLNITIDQLANLDALARGADAVNVSGLADRDPSRVQEDAKRLHEAIEKRGWLRRWRSRRRALRDAPYLKKELRVNGKPCKDREGLERLLVWLVVVLRLDSLRKHWSEYVEVSAKTFTLEVAKYEDLRKRLERVLDLRAKAEGLRVALLAIPEIAIARVQRPDELLSLLRAAEAALAYESMRDARAQLEAVGRQIDRALAGTRFLPPAAQMGTAVRNRDTTAYTRAHGALQRLHRLEQLYARLSAAAGGVADQLRGSAHQPEWDARMADFESAWNWAHADGWLGRLSEPGTQARLERELKRIREETVPELTRKLAAARAWAHCFQRLTEHERQHLVAWSKAMKKVGKGTGKYAAQHRAEARQHMDECRSAIPAWIMPVYRVAETVEPGRELYDVVIIDEASQSGAEALFLLYLARRVLVVGDDQQISPEDVGLDREDVDLLKERYISSLPHRDAIGPDTSLFSLAEIHYGGRIRLTEHFRCMPEIIEFSNRLCYGSQPLIALRQYGTDRLDPVKCTHVPEGYAEGEHSNVVNRPEADAIVSHIVECCKDPKYAGKSMGVISLQGWAQPREIERRLLQHLGPEEMERRHLVSGAPYAFQGDERDVIFLSMVAAPNQRIGTLADEDAKRRFNVAASRAKDQMWLFHTATLNDLSPKCMRSALLQYCQNPSLAAISSEFDLVQLRRLAAAPERYREDPPRPFESWFELDVFMKIAERRFRVVPQFRVAGYRIDLAVIGPTTRLAVECDGDRWHGLDRYEADMGRQMVLERCGWTFWRVGAGVFYRDPERALEGLWGLLGRLGICTDSAAPGGSTTRPRDTEVPREQSGLAACGTQQAMGAGPTLPAAGTDAPLLGYQESALGPVERAASSQHRGTSERQGITRDLFGMSVRAARPVGKTRARDRSQRLLSPSKYSMCASITAYGTWNSRPLPDPRTGPPEMVIQGLLEIIAAEGPITAARAARLYADACGLQRLGRRIRDSLYGAIRSAKRRGLLESTNEIGEKVIRKPGMPPVVVRAGGDRGFYEIPPSEVGELIKLLRLQNPRIAHRSLVRKVLEQYGLKHLTPTIRERIIKIMGRYSGQ